MRPLDRPRLRGPPTPTDAGITGNSYTLSPLDAGTSYTITVAAYNGSSAGLGQNTTPVSATTKPAAPGTITLQRGIDTLDATWPTQPYATGYQIAWCQGPTGCTPGTIVNLEPGQGGQTGQTSYTIDGLTPASEYSVFVRTIASSGSSDWAAASESTLDLPAPGNVTATGGRNQITVGFTQVPQADTYLLYLCAGSSCDPASATPVTITRPAGDQVTYTFGALNAATWYRFAVKASEKGATSPTSTIASARTDDPPPPPTPTPGSVQPVWAGATNASATFTWTPAAYATWYVCNGQNVGSQTSCAIAGPADSTIVANVQACNSAGCSIPSTVTGYANPNTPGQVTVSAVTDTCITATWTATAASNQYLLRAGTASQTVTGSTGTICGLNADTAYTITVAGINRGNNNYQSTWSTGAGVYTNPKAPGNVTFSFAGQVGGIGGDRCASLTWSSTVADNRYRILVNGTATQTVTGSTGTNACGITWNQTATFAVAAINRGNNTWTSQPGTAPGSLPATPAVPTGGNGVTRDGTENVTGGQTAVRGFTSTGASSYQVKRADAPAPWQVTAAPFNDSGLVWNTTYTYKLAACSTWGCSPYSGNISATSSPAPALFDAARNSDTTKIDVSVQNGAGSKGYRIRYCNRDTAPGCDPFSGQAVAWKTSNGTTTLTGLDRRSKYAIGVITSTTGDGQGAVTYSTLRYVTTG